MATASRTPLPPGVPNSMLGAMTAFRNDAQVFRDLAKKISEMAMRKFGTRQLSPVQKKLLMDELAAEKQLFAERVECNLKAAESKQFMPPPPRPRELYGRVADGCAVVDVGSGNLLRVAPESGRLKITAVDPLLPVDLVVCIKKEKREALPEDIADQVVTSFNALPNIPADSAMRAAIETQDGLHLVPDHGSLEKRGVGKWSDGRFLVSAPNAVFRDYPVFGPGINLDGYKLISYVKPRVISVMTGKEGVGDYTPSIDGSPGDPGQIDWTDIGWKWDGDPHELEISSDGTAMLTNRAGVFKHCSQSGGVPMSLHLEHLSGKHPIWVLIRVEYYNGFIPPHSGEYLRYFASKHEILIDKIPVVGPPFFDLKTGPVLNGVQYPVDGIVSRFSERDYYYKPGWTLDLYPDGVAYIKEFCSGAGLAFNMPHVENGLAEYLVERSAGKIMLKFIRLRPDKRTCTSNGTIAYILGLPTLVELVAVSGSTPMTTGIRDYFLEL